MANQPTAATRPLTYTEQMQLGRIATGALPDTENNKEVYTAQASRLVDFFPDKIIIQEKTVSVVDKQMFTSVINTLPIKDIGRVTYVNAPFFAGLEILGKNPTHDMRIVGLKKQDALKAKKFIEELMLFEQGSIPMPAWMIAGDGADHIANVDHPQVEASTSNPQLQKQ